MVNLSANYLIAALLALGPVVDVENPEASVVFDCQFTQDDDINHDSWPDNWTRRKGRGYPTYLNIETVDTQDKERGKALRVQVDGGAAAVYSPPFEVRSQFTYVVEALVKTVDLQHDQTAISLAFFDENKNLIGTRHFSDEINGTRDWTSIEIGPHSAETDAVRWGVLGLHVETSNTGRDLSGQAWFDDIRVSQLPRVTVKTNRSHNVFKFGEQPEITCKVAGISVPQPLITLQVEDVFGDTLQSYEQRLQGKVMQTGTAALLDDSGAEPNASNFHGEVTWKPEFPAQGYYRLHLRIAGAERVLYHHIINISLLPAPVPIDQTEFGWSLANGQGPHSLNDLTNLLTYTSNGWLKFPVWFSPSDQKRADQLANFVEQLSRLGVRLVGVIDQPPESVKPHFGAGDDRLPAVLIFGDEQVWFPAINPVMTRLSLKVIWWQLGNDDDTGFSDRNNLGSFVSNIRDKLQKYGQETRLGFAWSWMRAAPEDTENVSFLSLQSRPALTSDELETYINQLPPEMQGKRWVMIEPLSRVDHTVEARTRDLIRRMLSAKLSHAEGIFATNPFDPHTGLMDTDGTPGILFNPWCITARMIAGAEYLGSINLPSGSENHVFARGDQTVMVIWNDTPTREVINLGDFEDIKQIDAWGKPQLIATDAHRQVYEIGRLPVFITGIRRELITWRLSFAFTDPKLDTIFQQGQRRTLTFHNAFINPADGTLKLNLPEAWGKPPLPRPLKLAGGETATLPYDVTLKTNVSNGTQRVRVDFDVTVDKPYKFSLWRNLEIGTGDVTMSFSTHIDRQGQLIVQQTLTNNSDVPVTFKCLLFSPGRRRLRHNVVNLEPGRDVRKYVLSDGEELLEKTLWVHAEQIGGERVMNYRFEAKP